MLIRFSGGFTPVLTEPDGYWSKSGLAGTVTVTPADLVNYTFDGATATVTGARDDVDFTIYEIYTASGKVTSGSGSLAVNVGGVTIAFSGGFTSVTTAADDTWIKSGLHKTVTVTPAKTGYVFTPASRPVDRSNRTDINFTCTYTIGGEVTCGALKVANAQILVSGHGNTTTDINGRWTMSGVSGQVTVTAQKTGYYFTPGLITASGPRTDVNFNGTYTISGKVLNGDTTGGLGEVVIRFNGFNPLTTAPDGTWEKAGLQGNITVTVIASRTGYGFSPADRVISGPTSVVSFAGYQKFTASGHVSCNGQPLGGVTSQVESFGDVTTDAAGNWSKAGVFGSFDVTPSLVVGTLPATVFSPQWRHIGKINPIADFGVATYAVSGKLWNQSGSLIAGYTLNFTNGMTATTNANGIWTLSLSGATDDPIVLQPETGATYYFDPTLWSVKGPRNDLNFVRRLVIS